MDRRGIIEDELLVLRCQEGDAPAFEALVDRWQNRLWRHACRLTGNEEAALDAVQETWIAISHGIRRLNDVTAFPAWAYRIASNKCRDWIRRESRRRKIQEDWFADDAAQREAAAQTDADPARNVDEALQRLPGKDRSILSLRYEEGFDTAAIAAILDVPEGTVKSRLFYARQRLKETLEAMNHE